MRSRIIYLLVIVLLLPCMAHARKKKENPKEAVTERKDNRYEELFRDKACETVKGLLTLHKVDGKIYFEIPTKLMNREMLLGSTISGTTDNMFGSIGERPSDPLLVTFTQKDSTLVSLGLIQTTYMTQNETLKERMNRGNIPAVIKNFEIKAYTPDSTAVVVDMTDFLLSDNETLPSFSPWSPILSMMWGSPLNKNFMREESQVLKMKAFEDNVTVQSQLAFRLSAETSYFRYCSDKPVTQIMTRNFILLPEIPARPRYADPRIGVFYQGMYEMGDPKKGIDVLYYATRWRLEPTDEEAYRRGELVEPKKPIVFYVDNAFPDQWKKYIKEGICEWNAAFEKIGFKNVMRAEDFPTNDPDFDPDNLKYSCIRYSPSIVANAMGPSWTDPRTGEILNASVYVYHNLVELVQDWRFLQTAAADPSVRKIRLDDKDFGDCLRYVLAHEVGHTLGLMHNMSASAAIPTDSLRSPSFTRKYGTTYSIMDYARNNYVAQPGDAARGVKMTPPRLGLYDYYVIEWLYKPLLDIGSAREEIPVLDQFITERSDNPVYRYGKQQFREYYDPRAMEEDLGDDPVKSATYGVKNLKYVLEHMDEWVKDEDKDYKFRKNMLNEARYQFARYLNHVMCNLGGLYLNERYENDKVPAYGVVSRERQKNALRFVLELTRDFSWLDDMKGLPLGREVAEEFQKDILRGLLMIIHKVAMTQTFSDEKKPFSREEYLSDLYDFVMTPTLQGKKLTKGEQSLQKGLLAALLEASGAQKKDMGMKPFEWNLKTPFVRVPESVRALSREKYGEIGEDVMGRFTNRRTWGEQRNMQHPAEVSGFGDPFFLFKTFPMEPDNYTLLRKMYSAFKGKQNVGTPEMQQYYKLMVRQMDNIFND